MYQNNKVLLDVAIGDEACFSIAGTVNTYNFRMYAPKCDKPDFTFQRNNSRQKSTIWSGMCGNGILLAPYFFERNVDGGNYLEILNELILPQLNENFHNQLKNGILQRS